MLSDADHEDHQHPSLRLIEIEKKSVQCGFHLTRSKFDPYPWVSNVDKDSAAFSGGLKLGDCVLEVNGTDIIGKRISEIAEIVKSNSEQVSLLLWNAGVDAQCSPQTLCCGPLPTNLQKLVSCVSTILAFLECPICLETIPRPTYQCDNGHLICLRCRSKTERCPVCRIRLHRGRSLMADHILTTIADAFTSSEDLEESRLAKLHSIFKQKYKKKNIPDIKITESYTNKLFSKIAGKSSSADNLSSSKYLSPNSTPGDGQLKIKSLSANAMFVSESPVLSRNSSYSRLSINSLNIENNKNREGRPISYHGSCESLDRKTNSISPVCSSFTSTEGLANENYLEISYYCPFSNSCVTALKGVAVFEHFLREHSYTGPLIQYFTPNLEINLRELRENQDYCFSISTLEQTFFLKIILGNEDTDNSCDILLWVWYLGSKGSSRNYGAEIQMRNILSKEVLLRVRSSVLSLSSTSYQEIKESKKGVYLSSKSIEALGFPSNKLLLIVKISENDM